MASADDAISVSDLGDRLFRHCSLGDAAGSADVCFVVGGHKFYAHRSVLAARSPAFKDLFFSPTTAAASSTDASAVVSLHGIEPQTFQALLRFMYTGTLPKDDDDEMLRNLVAAADMYGMDSLKLMCAQRLYERVSVETVVATMCFAETHRCPELKNRCMDFFMEENFYQVVCSKGYFQLLPDYPSVLDEIRARIVSQTESSSDEYFHSSPSEPGFITF